MVEKKATILVTGCNGQLGNELQCIALFFPSYHFVFTDRETLDICNADAVNAFFQRTKPNYCINAAAYTAVDKAEEEQVKCYLVNAIAVGYLADACQAINAKMIHISTDYVFNGKSETPYKEEDLTDPINFYGYSKRAGENLALEKTDACIIRTAWVYSSFGKNFVKTMLHLMQSRESLSIVDDQVGSPTFAQDLAFAIMQIIGSDIWMGGIYHFANYGKISWFTFAEMIKKYTHSSCLLHPIKSIDYPQAAKRPSFSLLNTDKIQRDFDVEITPWGESLQRCLIGMDVLPKG